MTPRLSREEIERIRSDAQEIVKENTRHHGDEGISLYPNEVIALCDMALSSLAPVGLAEPIGLEPVRKRLKRGQYRTLPAETTEADIAFLLSLIDDFRSRLHAQEGRWIRYPMNQPYPQATAWIDNKATHVATTGDKCFYLLKIPSPTAGGGDEQG